MKILHREYQKSYLFGRQNAPISSNISAGDHIKFNHIQGSYGNKIQLDISTAYNTTLGLDSIGRIKLKKGYIYDLMSSVQALQASSGVSIFFAWYNATTNAQLGSGGAMVSSNAFQPFVTAALALTVIDLTKSTEDMLIELRIVSVNGTITAIGTTTNFPWFRCIQR